ncbi:MAG TPA: glycosyltransferase [Pyrinomonadaceae bacterium]|nr:glycosyltransferase [Pyrinomonadaceae bacterium]
MAPDHDPNAAGPPPPNLLAVSFAFPPLAYPRSIQVARLLKHSSARTALVCADERGARRDETIERDAEGRLARVVRVRFAPGRLRREADRLARRLRPPLWDRWNRSPDQYRGWVGPAATAAEGLVGAGFGAGVLATFSQPATSHLVGLELKERLGLPWVAHFSDPWVGNPFHRLEGEVARVNAELERRVVERADRLVFTSEETIELVLRNYPPALAAKARVLPQCFDESQYAGRHHGPADESKSTPDSSAAAGPTLIVRHLGTFYGRRSPEHLFRAVAALLAADPSALAGVRFEFNGLSNFDVLRDAGGDALPAGMLSVGPAVPYLDSLALMRSADGLLILDAPAERSVFLPSKLIDYAGAARPVLGLTPEGAAASLIRRLGGWVADPADTPRAAEALASFVAFLRSRRAARDEDWGNPEVRAEYEAARLAARFDEILKELAG